MNFEYDKVTPGAKPDSQEKFLEAIAEICHGKRPLSAGAAGMQPVFQ